MMVALKDEREGWVLYLVVLYSHGQKSCTFFLKFLYRITGRSNSVLLIINYWQRNPTTYPFFYMDILSIEDIFTPKNQKY